MYSCSVCGKPVPGDRTHLHLCTEQMYQDQIQSLSRQLQAANELITIYRNQGEMLETRLEEAKVDLRETSNELAVEREHIQLLNRRFGRGADEPTIRTDRAGQYTHVAAETLIDAQHGLIAHLTDELSRMSQRLGGAK